MSKRWESRSIDFEAAGRVLARVETAGGSALRRAPAETTRDWGVAIIAAIGVTFAMAASHADLTSDARSKRRYSELGRVGEMARRLLATIEDEDLPLTEALASHFGDPRHGSSIAIALRSIRELQSAARTERARLEAEGLAERAAFSASAEDVAGSNAPPAIGTETDMAMLLWGLADVFQDFFGMEPAIGQHTTTREPAGPFLAFLLAVMEEVGRPMKPEAIRKAWDRAQDKRLGKS